MSVIIYHLTCSKLRGELHFLHHRWENLKPAPLQLDWLSLIECVAMLLQLGDSFTAEEV
jgi:hypothetical protein